MLPPSCHSLPAQPYHSTEFAMYMHGLWPQMFGGGVGGNLQKLQKTGRTITIGAFPQDPKIKNWIMIEKKQKGGDACLRSKTKVEK